ncbi:MAG TPA: ABC transporter permease [Acidimicrobiia bacterium]|nr:ABC transporter permease [Acidimicrobiia bacterium]
MARVIARSVFSLLLAALMGSLIVFALLRSIGGDVALIILGQEAAPGAYEALREQLGLDRPWFVQYGEWLAGVFTGDLGTSYSARFDIYQEILRRLGPTTLLAFGSLLLSAPLALILGTWSAINSKKIRGGIVDVFSQIGIAIPAFWAGLIMVVIFGIRLGWLPTGGYTSPFDDFWRSVRQLVMPTLALSLGMTSVLTRYVRSAMLDVMDEDFIRTARAKGRTRRGAALVHGVRNASVSLVTVGTLQLGSLMAGTVVIENVFVIPGIGRLLVTSVLGREVIVVQSLILVILLMILVMNFLMDIAYVLIDPRIRDSQGGEAIA